MGSCRTGRVGTQEGTQNHAFVGGEANLLVGEIEVIPGEEQPPHLLGMLGRAADPGIIGHGDEVADRREVEGPIQLAGRMVGRAEAIVEGAALLVEDQTLRAK